MLVTSVFLIGSHWFLDSNRSLIGIAGIFLIVIFNLSMLSAKQIRTPWGVIPARSDAFDALRWCINFPIDIFIFWNLNIDLSTVICIWLLLTFGAMTEVYERKYKLITVSVGFISFLIMTFSFSDVELKSKIYIASCFLSLIFALWKLQQYVSDEMVRVMHEQIERQQLEFESEALQRDAAIGYSTRAINHELNTLIGVANISAFQLQASTEPEHLQKEIDRLDKSLSYMGRVSSLILDGLGNRNADKRVISVNELYDDLKLLLCANNKHHQNLSFEFTPDTLNLTFEERTGSTYLIIHNLVKNAREAVSEKFGNGPDGKIQISATKINNDVQISVFDNGVGLSAQSIVDIYNREGNTTKPGGSGLGMRFVAAECDKNSMPLEIESIPRQFSRFIIKIAIHGNQSSHLG